MPSPYKKYKLNKAIFLAAFVVGGIVILPLMFGQKITVSPLLLIAVAIMPNFIWTLIPTTEEDDGRVTFSRVFNIRLVASVACAFLLLAIYRIAYSLGSAG